MRRTITIAAGLTALLLGSAAAAQSQTQTPAPSDPPALPNPHFKPATPGQAAGAAGNLAELGDPACGTPRNVGDHYWAPPMFPDQTRAPHVSGRQPFRLEVVASHVDHPWALAFLPDGKLLVTIRAGGMRTIAKDGTVSEPLAGTPVIEKALLSAMYDVRLDRDFAKNRTLYFGYITKSPNGPQGVGRVVRARLSLDDKTLEDLKVIHEADNFLPRRIVQARDGTLFVTAGEINSNGPAMQSLTTERGKVLRINTDGSIPKGNPDFGKDADPALYAIGFRDQEGAQINPDTGELWTTENEPKGGDELNVIKPGGNYGFPVVSYGRENSGALINGGKTYQEGMIQPVYYWTPSIAPSGFTFYNGKALPGWKGDIFIAAMSGEQLIRLELKNGRVTGEERLLKERCHRLRDVRQGPDGMIYILEDETDGSVLRLAPG